MPASACAKYSRSSRLAKPASCDVLPRRTSTIRLTPASFSRPKKCSALVRVKPMLKSCTRSSLDEIHEQRLARAHVAFLDGEKLRVLPKQVAELLAAVQACVEIGFDLGDVVPHRAHV